MYVLIGVCVLIGVSVLWMISVYNGLVVSRNRYQNAFAQIDIQLKRRYDLIPNLVEMVKGAMAHEKGVLEAVVAARNLAYTAGQKAAVDPGDPDTMKRLGQAEGQLGGALTRLLAVSEAYPDLKANANMLALQEELTSTENKVGFARQGFNDAVTAFNSAREVFPAVAVAGMLGFKRAALFEIENPVEREAPKVRFD